MNSYSFVFYSEYLPYFYGGQYKIPNRANIRSGSGYYNAFWENSRLSFLEIQLEVINTIPVMFENSKEV